MTVLEALKQSPSWSTKWDLPTFPYTNNAWVYMAYALKLSLERNETDFLEHLRSKWDALIAEHQVLPGLIRRIDTNIAGSHDEILGISYMSFVLKKNTHKEIYEYLKSNFWYRYDTNFEAPWWRKSMIRFNDLPGYVQAYGRGWVGPIATFRYCLAVVLRGFNANKGLAGGVSDDLRTWLSSSVMKTRFFPKLALKFWAKKCKENNMDLAGLFSNEPKEPVLVLKAEGISLLS